jgi:hypothetical protein
MDPTIGLLAGTGWASGVNLYGVVLLLGVLGRVGWSDDVPELLTRPEVLALAGGLYLLEFVVDKVPYLDDLWDVVHTAVRPLGAAALGAILAGDTLPDLAAAVGTGGVAFVSHAVKATTRLAVNTSPEPVSTTAVSLAEDGLVAGVVTLAVLHPLVALVVVIALLLGGAVLVVVVVRATRRGLARWRARRAARRPGRVRAEADDDPVSPPRRPRAR